MAPKVEQDGRITLVTYNDETLFNTGIRSPLDRTLLANALGNLDQMGAKAIGIDIAFDSPRPDDDVLKAQLRAMRTPTWLAYAEQASNPNKIGRAPVCTTVTNEHLVCRPLHDTKNKYR